jgi:hypothetical protein
MERRLSGMTFKQIGVAEGVSRVHKLYWRALDANPFDPKRLRRQTARRSALTAGT